MSRGMGTAGPGTRWQGRAPAACGVSVGLWAPPPQMPFSPQVLAQQREPPGEGGHLCPQVGTRKWGCPARYDPGVWGLGSAMGTAPAGTGGAGGGQGRVQGCSWLCFLLGCGEQRDVARTPSLALVLVSHVVAVEMHEEMQWKRDKWVRDPTPGCQGVAELPVPPRWSLQRSQEGTREPGSGAKPRSQGDRARYGGSRDGSGSEAGAEGGTGSPRGDGHPVGDQGCGDGVPGAGLAWHCWDTPGTPITGATRTCRGW